MSQASLDFSTEFRVDRTPTLAPPCGMNSILYLGDSLSMAHTVARTAKPGLDPWGNPSPTHGVLLSRWDRFKRVYVPLRFKAADGTVTYGKPN